MDNKPLIKFGALFVFLAAIGGSFLAGAYYGYQSKPAISKITGVNNLEADKPEGVDFSVFWKTWNILNDKYVNDNGTSTDGFINDNQKKVWGAVTGLVDSLDDPYTIFLPQEEKKLFEEDIKGNFGGVGMELGMKEGKVTVVAPLPNTPAFRAGILTGDRILKVNDKSTDGLAVDQVVKSIRGKPGTTVKLLIGRSGREPFEIKLIRATINVPSLKTEFLKDDNIFVIRLYNFSEPAPDAFRAALREFIGANTDKLIIDMRGNPGGYLEAAVDIASWFLPEGRVVVKEYYGGKSADKVHRSRGYDVFNDQLKLVILVDGGSASAAEILAGALSEYGEGILVGEKTFGKGSVQELVNVDDQTSIKITIAKWLTPRGKSISSDGLVPQVIIKLTEEDRTKGRDPQQVKAVEILKEMKK